MEVKDPYEGMYQGIHFNAVNIRLYHVYKAGHIRDGYEKEKKWYLRDLLYDMRMLRLRFLKRIMILRQ